MVALVQIKSKHTAYMEQKLAQILGSFEGMTKIYEKWAVNKNCNNRR